jgi:hypothetical protein
MDLTIVIPLYNRKEYIRATLESVVGSGVSYRQIIIVDNGSDDGSYEYACSLSKLYGDRVMVVQELRRGAAAARNRGLELCCSSWVYFFDSDDIFTGLPNSWDEGADMVCIPTQQSIGGRLRTRAYKAVSSPHTQILSSMLNTVSMIFSVSFLRGIGGWNEDCRSWDDWELGVRSLIRAERVEWVTSRAYHRILIHDDSITGGNFSDRYVSHLGAMGAAFDDVLLMSDGTEKDRCLFALFLRCYILSGLLLREGDSAGSAAVHGFINERFMVGGYDYKLGHLVEWYVSKGGRGAWRIALKMVEMAFK